MFSGAVVEARSQTLPSGANDSGTVIRLRQFDALHHRRPATATSSLPCGMTRWPGWKLPVPLHRLDASSASGPGLGTSSAGKPTAATSQLMPMIGTATSEHGTLLEQPS